MDFESDDPVPGIPPSADDATDTVIASFSLSDRSGITTPRVSKTIDRVTIESPLPSVSSRLFHPPLQLLKGLYPLSPTFLSTHPFKIPHIRIPPRQPLLTPPRHCLLCGIITRIDHPTWFKCSQRWNLLLLTLSTSVRLCLKFIREKFWRLEN